MEITYSFSRMPDTSQIIDLYRKAELPRPIDDENRIQKMFEGSNLVVSAWDGEKLVGVSRSITDWSWSCYLADLAVDPDYQKLGIGKKLVDVTRERAGTESMILLLSVPTAFEYYPKIGFEKENRAFMIPRKK